MKTELEQFDIESIAEAIANKLKPIILAKEELPDNGLLNMKDLINYLNVKKDWIYQKVHNGTIPHYKIEGLLRFKRSEIDAWIKKRSLNDKKSLELC